jgi:hypothetical protein
MPWRKFAKHAMLNHLRITGWPRKVRPPGGSFELKSLGVRALHALVARFIDCVRKGETPDNVLRVERWTEGMLRSFPFCCCC